MKKLFVLKNGEGYFSGNFKDPITIDATKAFDFGSYEGIDNAIESNPSIMGDFFYWEATIIYVR